MVPTALDKKVLARQLRFGRCGSGGRTVTTGIEKTTLVVLWVKVKITISQARKCGRVNGLGTGYHYRCQSLCSLLSRRLLKLLRFWMEKSSQSKCGFMHASSSRQRTSRCDKAVIAAVFFPSAKRSLNLEANKCAVTPRMDSGTEIYPQIPQGYKVNAEQLF